MSARRVQLAMPDGRELRTAAVATCATLLLALLAVAKLGLAVLVPPALVLVAVLLSRPRAAIAALVGATVLCEGPSFGFLEVTSHLYDQIYKGLTPLDVLVVLTVLSVAIDLVRRRRPLRVPRPLLPGLGLLLLAMIAGASVGHGAGASLRSVLLAENVLTYLLLLPVAVANLELDRRQLERLLLAGIALASLKAALGLVEIASGLGQSIEGSSRLTYYEPAPNWLIMIALLGVFAAALARARLPRWGLVCGPLLIASLLLSYRRSFWIAAALGLLLVLLLGTSASGRRLLLPVGLLVAVAIWLLGSVGFQAQSPLLHRAESLSPTSLRGNAEDRYRLDERADVFSVIQEHPLTGLGLTIPWSAAAEPLSVEHENGREYVHFAALWFWLKLGVLGLLAYAALLTGGLALAWQAWRRAGGALARAFALASMCALVGLLAMDTTASFTGVDARFTVLLGAQLGLLALIARLGGRGQPPRHS